MSDWPRNRRGLLANERQRGALSSALYQRLTGTPPSYSLDPVKTDAATGSFVTLNNSVTSTLDTSITSLAYRAKYNTGYTATKTGKMVLVLCCAGFCQDGITQFDTTFLERTSGIVSEEYDYAPCIVATRTRGRSPALGTTDYARGIWDLRDIRAHAAAAIGPEKLFDGGNSAVYIGYSTGAHEVLRALSCNPDEVTAAGLWVPNTDLGQSISDGYWGLQSPANRALLTTQVGARGDGTTEKVDPYLVRYPYDSVQALLDLSEDADVPYVFVFGDPDDAVTSLITDPVRLVDSLGASARSRAQLIAYLTHSGDALRIAHDDGVNGNGATQIGERIFWPLVLNGTRVWTMPRTARNLYLQGWMRLRETDTSPAVMMMTGSTASPLTSLTGGTSIAGRLDYRDKSRTYEVTPYTSQAGYLYVERDEEKRVFALSPEVRCVAALDISPKLTTLADLAAAGFTKAWDADAGVTGSPVTDWAEQFGVGGWHFAYTAGSGVTSSPTFGTTAVTNAPYIRFTATSQFAGQALLLAGPTDKLLVNPKLDFTLAFVMAKIGSSAQMPFAVAHHGTLSALNVVTSVQGAACALSGQYLNAAFAQQTTPTEMGGQTWSLTVRHLIVLVRRSGKFYYYFDNSKPNIVTVTGDDFLTTGTNSSSLGCAWANTAGQYYNFLDGDCSGIYVSDVALSPSIIGGLFYYAKTKYVF